MQRMVGQMFGRKGKGPPGRPRKKAERGVHRGEENVNAKDKAAVTALAKGQMLALSAKDLAAVVGQRRPVAAL